MRGILLLIAIVLVCASGCNRQTAPSSSGAQSTNPQSPTLPSEAELNALASLEPIDTHTHVAKGDPAFYAT